MLFTNILLILSFSKVQQETHIVSFEQYGGVSHNYYLTYFHPLDFKLSVAFNVLFTDEAQLRLYNQKLLLDPKSCFITKSNMRLQD